MTPQPENPSHYDVPGTGAQLIDILRSAGEMGVLPAWEFFLWSSMLQYAFRFYRKGTPHDDLKKCRVYLNWLIDCYAPVDGSTYATGGIEFGKAPDNAEASYHLRPGENSYHLQGGALVADEAPVAEVHK